MKLFQIALLGCDVGWDGDDDETRPGRTADMGKDVSAIVQRGAFHRFIHITETEKQKS